MSKRGTSPGPGVDALGQAVVDPTQNVLDLVHAAIQRQDDLREADSRRLTELAQLRADYEAQLREAETARINAIRSVDVGAAGILANQVAASAEALRGQVEAARQQTATSLGNALEPIQKDIQDLRRAQYEAQGVKANVTDSSTASRATIAIIISAALLLVAILSVYAALKP